MTEEKVYRQSRLHLIVWIVIDILFMVIVIGWILLIGHILQYLRNALIITPRGITLKKGLITKSSIEIPFNKINSVSVRKGLFGNLFGYGDIVILTGNDVSGIPFNGVEKPDLIKEEIMQKVHSILGSGENHSYIPMPTPAVVPSDPYREIEQLARLKEQGIISDAEFTEKKKSLLQI